MDWETAKLCVKRIKASDRSGVSQVEHCKPLQACLQTTMSDHTVDLWSGSRLILSDCGSVETPPYHEYAAATEL